MRQRRTVRRIRLINITSLIDVMFLLVIFLLLTATFTRETEVKVNLPTSQAPTQTDTQPVVEVLTITDKGELYLGTTRYEFDMIGEAIKNLRKQKSDPLLQIRCDQGASASILIRLTEAILHAGQSKISLQLATPLSPAPLGYDN